VIFYSFEFLMLLACAIAFYKAAVMESALALLWAMLSMLMFLLTWIVLGWGKLGSLAGQAGLFIIITIVKMMRRR